MNKQLTLKSAALTALFLMAVVFTAQGQTRDDVLVALHENFITLETQVNEMAAGLRETPDLELLDAILGSSGRLGDYAEYAAPDAEGRVRAVLDPFMSVTAALQLETRASGGVFTETSVRETAIVLHLYNVLWNSSIEYRNSLEEGSIQLERADEGLQQSAGGGMNMVAGVFYQAFATEYDDSLFPLVEEMLTEAAPTLLHSLPQEYRDQAMEYVDTMVAPLVPASRTEAYLRVRSVF